MILKYSLRRTEDPRSLSRSTKRSLCRSSLDRRDQPSFTSLRHFLFFKSVDRCLILLFHSLSYQILIIIRSYSGNNMRFSFAVYSVAVVATLCSSGKYSWCVKSSVMVNIDFFFVIKFLPTYYFLLTMSILQRRNSSPSILLDRHFWALQP